ncbi:MAG: YfhO family protein [Candidatus Sumerlaeaceae bacterium]|nr:YfhO family protein [Candidatus Sumerlaeaceae bacterium]
MSRNRRPRDTRNPPASGAATETSGAAPVPFEIPAWSAYLLAALAALAVYIPFLPKMTGQYLGHPLTDMNSQYRHYIAFAVQSLARGEVPLWNPYVFCGTPFLPSTMATLFYPVNLPFLMLLPQPVSVNICIMVHAALLGAFTVHYARGRALGNVAALFAGVCAGLCAVIPCRVFAGHFTIVTTVVWFPLLLCFQERMFREGWRWVAPLGIVAALAVLGGHTQYVFYAGLLMGANLLLWMLLEISAGRGRWFVDQMKWHLAAAALAALLAGVELVHLLDVFRYSARGGIRDEGWLRFFSMPFENFASLLAPNFIGAGLQYWGRWYAWETCFYIGVPALGFLLLALARELGHRRTSPLMVLFLLSVFLSCAGLIPGVRNIVGLVPGWAVFRGHAKILGPAMIIGAVIAAHGFDAALRDATGKVAALAGKILGGLTVVVVIWLVMSDTIVHAYLVAAMRRMDSYSSIDPMKPANVAFAERIARAALFTAVGLFILSALLCFCRKPFGAKWWSVGMLVLLASDLGYFAFLWANVSFPAQFHRTPPSVADFFRSTEGKGRVEMPAMDMMCEAMTIPADSASGHEINITKYYDTFICALRGVNRGAPSLKVDIPQDRPWLDAANLKYVYLGDPAPAEVRAAWPGVKPAAQVKDGTIFERPSAMPRAWVVGKATWVPDNEDAILDAMIGGVDIRKSVLLAGSEVQQQESSTAEAVAAEVAYKGAGRAEITAPADGWLVLADGFSPAWKATVNGRPAKVWRANGAFRAVEVAKGDPVVFVLSSAAFWIGAGLSGAGLLLSGLLFVRRKAA